MVGDVRVKAGDRADQPGRERASGGEPFRVQRRACLQEGGGALVIVLAAIPLYRTVNTSPAACTVVQQFFVDETFA